MLQINTYIIKCFWRLKLATVKKLKNETALSLHGLHGNPYINQSIMFHLPETVQPQKTDNKHALAFIQVSTFVRSWNKHSSLLLNQCMSVVPFTDGLVLNSVTPSGDLSSGCCGGQLTGFSGLWSGQVGWRKTKYNPCSFSPQSEIRSVVFDRIHSCPCVKNKMMSDVGYGDFKGWREKTICNISGRGSLVLFKDIPINNCLSCLEKMYSKSNQ